MDYFPYDIPNKDRLVMDVIQEIAPLAEEWEIIKEINLLHADVGILYRSFNTLSGGELKRIELAIALAKGGEVFLFDEPEAGIDLWSFEKLNSLFEKDKYIFFISQGGSESGYANANMFVVEHRDELN